MPGFFIKYFETQRTQRLHKVHEESKLKIQYFVLVVVCFVFVVLHFSFLLKQPLLY